MLWLLTTFMAWLVINAAASSMKRIERIGKKRLFYLVIVVMTMEERLLPEDHTRQHTAQAPHVEAVVIHLKCTTSVRRSTDTTKTGGL